MRVLAAVALVLACSSVIHSQTNPGGKKGKQLSTLPQQSPPSGGKKVSAADKNNALAEEQKQQNAPAPPVQGPTNGAQQLLSMLQGQQFPADYIPCVFTQAELFRLRLQPVSSTLTSADAEELKENLFSEGAFQESLKTLSPDQKNLFFQKVAAEHFEGLNPSEAIALVVSILNDVNRSDLAQAAKGGGDQLLSLVEARLSIPLPRNLNSDVKTQLEKGLLGKFTPESGGAVKATDIPQELTVLANNAINARNILSSQQDFNTDYYIYTMREDLGQLATEASNAAKQLQTDSASKENAQDWGTAVINTARNTVAGFQRPKDVGCAMSILSWNETRYAFGSMVANEYIGVEVVVRNLNDKTDFVLHDSEFAVDSDINGRLGRYYSGRDKVIVRGLSIAQQNANVRNLLVHSAEAVGTLMSAVIPVAGGTFKDAAGVYNGGFLPGLRSTWPDLSVTQLNLLNDVGFSSTTNYKTVVPKSGSVMFVMFVPSKQFEDGWWTQQCVTNIAITKDLNFSKANPTSPTQTTTQVPTQKPSGLLGIDLDLARIQCLSYLMAKSPSSIIPSPTPQRSPTPQGQPTSKNTQGISSSDEELPQDRLTSGNPLVSSSIPDNLHLILTKPVHYKHWAPSSLAIFRELAFTVVAGTHIQEESQQQPSLIALACPRDDLGNLQFGAMGSPISCDISGANLDKISSIRLRNADNPADATTAEGTASVSGDSTKGKVAFPDDKLCSLQQSAYKAFAITSGAVELSTTQVLHFDPRPLLRAVEPTDAIDPVKTPSPKIILKGCHLDRIAEIQLTGTVASGPQSIKPSLDSGGTPVQVSFTVDTVKTNIQTNVKDPKNPEGESLSINMTVKPPFGGQVNSDKKIVFKSTPTTSNAPVGQDTIVKNSKVSKGPPAGNSSSTKSKTGSGAPVGKKKAVGSKPQKGPPTPSATPTPTKP